VLCFKSNKSVNGYSFHFSCAVHGHESIGANNRIASFVSESFQSALFFDGREYR
jgi:hypothetical protein